MTATDLETRPDADTDTGDGEHISHYFCPDQSRAWTGEEPATARCGKTKSGWVDANGECVICYICYEFAKKKYCTHCEKAFEQMGDK